MRRLALLTLLLLAAPLCADATEDKVRDLITRLGDNSWETRERSQRELVGIGEPARKQLKEALENKDLEIRNRASSALIAIGESFSHAVECAAANTPGLREHGKAALANLFRIDDPQNLRPLSAQELQMRYFGGNEELRMTQPPALALARLESVSGIRLFIAPAAQKAWAQLLAQPSLDLSIGGDPRQAPFVKMGLENTLRVAFSGDASGEFLRVVPMRVGRATFFYLTTGTDAATADQGRRVGEELIEALLGEDSRSVRAAALLAEGAATDSIASDRIRKEYLADPDSVRLMWLALALGPDDALREAVRKQDPAQAVKLLDSMDWAALGLAARFLECLPPTTRGPLLDPVITKSKGTMAVMAALCCARGCELAPESRQRAGALLATREDGVAAASVRWFAGASELSDTELEQVWKAAEIQQPDSAFFEAAIELVARPDIAQRLVERAGKALSGVQETQQALAAAVLTGRARPADLSVALDKLQRRDRPGLTQRLSAMFTGCTELDEAAQTKLVNGLCHDDAVIRREFAAALRACDGKLRKEVVARWSEKITTAFGEGDESKVARKFVHSRIALWAFQAGLGEPKAMEDLMACATGQDAEKAKLAGGALPDAMAEDVLGKELDAMRARAQAPHAAMVSAEVYLEYSRRAVAKGDRATFRKYYGLAITMNFPNNYMMRNELMQLQIRLNRLPDGGPRQEVLPRGPILNKLELE